MASIFYDFEIDGQASTETAFDVERTSLSQHEAWAYRNLFIRKADPHCSSIKQTLEFLATQTENSNALLVFSLWTTSLLSEGMKDILSASGRMPILFETFDGYSQQITIAYEGSIIETYKQLVAEAKDVKPGSQHYDELVEQLQIGERIWVHPNTHHRFLLLICGEINCITSGGSSRNPVEWDRRVFKVDPIHEYQVDCVLNPSHTNFRPQAIRDKQRYLSGDGRTVVSCNNLYSGLKNSGKGSSRTTNFCWQNGRGLERPSITNRPSVMKISLA